MGRDAPLFAVVAPMKDEAEAVAPLAREIEAACAPLGPFEALFVDDGSTDATAERLAEARRAHPWLRVLRHAESCGQSAAVASGVRAARAPLICTIDGDGQNPPAEIPKLLAPLLAPDRPETLGLVCGVRVARRDAAGRRVASRAANALRRALLHDGTPDTGCGLKAFPKAAFLDLPYFDHMHRYLPSLFLRDGWAVAHVDVDHRPRAAGRTKYSNVGRALVGALDLVGVWWLMRRRRLATVVEVAGGADA
ncbi:MAG: glycosyltransferase family 2 protein [Rhodobacteraceae bacterium]|nr:MAG: glycosyltransferase family 2 protein [Paracoccaceae bacterium]